MQESPLLPEETLTEQDGLKILAQIILRKILREGRKKPLITKDLGSESTKPLNP